MMGWILPGLLVLLWQGGAELGVIGTAWLPSPLAIAATLCELAASGELWGHILVTTLRVLSGFAVGATLGTVTGALTGYYRPLWRLLDPMLQALRNIPGLAWVPLYLLWFGIFEQSKILLIATGVFFPVYLTLSTGITQADRRLIEVGRVFEFDARTTLQRIILPAALPYWVTALRNGMGLGWMFVVAAELMGASRGVGFLMYDAQQVGRADIIIAMIIMFALLGKLSDWALESAGRRLLRYQQAA